MEQVVACTPVVLCMVRRLSIFVGPIHVTDTTFIIMEFKIIFLL